MATIAEVQAALAARRERQKEDGPVEKSKPEGKAKARKKTAKPKIGEEKLSTLMKKRMEAMEEQGFADGGVVHDAGKAKAASGVGGVLNLADGGAVHASPYQKRGGNYRKTGKTSTR